MYWVELGVWAAVVEVSVVGGWGFVKTAPPLPSTGLAETADGHTITADAATPTENGRKYMLYINVLSIIS